MEDIHKMILGTEDSIRKYFPSKWARNDVEEFISPTYEIDLGSLNDGLNTPIVDFLFRGGKRLRPVLFLTCLDVFGLDYKKYFDVAAFIELIHNGTLVLDDIEDRSVLRRGKPTLHLKYGLDIATNIGASLHLLPLRVLTKSLKKHPVFVQTAVWDVVVEELVNVSFGQALDIYWHTHKTPIDISLNKYLEMVSLKTGSLMRMSVALACVISDHENVKRLSVFRSFAQDLGIAFQIIDDCLDIDPPDNNFGKSYGNDITEGKLSLPVVYCLKNPANKDRDRLNEILGKHTRSRKLINEAISIIMDTSSITKARKFAEELVDNAFYKLEKNAVANDRLDRLQELTYLLIKRSY